MSSSKSVETESVAMVTSNEKERAPARFVLAARLKDEAAMLRMLETYWGKKRAADLTLLHHPSAVPPHSAAS
jgi:hypothetical protein